MDYLEFLEGKLAEARTRIAVVERALWNCARFDRAGEPNSAYSLFQAWIETGTAQKDLDFCQLCNGSRGGVRGKEQTLDGLVVCSDCHGEDTYSRVPLEEQPSSLTLV